MVPEKMGIAFGHLRRRLSDYFARQILKTFAGIRIRKKIADKLLPFDAMRDIGVKQHAADKIDAHIQKSFRYQIQLPENFTSLSGCAGQVHNQLAVFLGIL
jgi:hypothetical protein